MRRPVELIVLKKMPGGGSDSTLKKEVLPLANGLETISALRPVSWKWNDEDNGERHYGFIAQEVEKILPDLVSDDTWRDGSTRKFLTVGDMMPYIVLALQEQQKQILKLKQQLQEKSQ